MEIKKLELETSDPAKLGEFYGSVLGLPYNFVNTSEIQIRIGDSELRFKQALSANPFYHFAINIPCNKVGEAERWLQARTNLIWIEDHNSYVADFAAWKAKSVYFEDPAGNIVELIGRTPLRNESTLDFSSDQFLSVSEIGIAFNAIEMEKNTAKLISEFSLDYFKRQPPTEKFKALGDDEGLFILVPGGRNWYPTHTASGIFPIKIAFTNKGKAFSWDNFDF